VCGIWLLEYLSPPASARPRQTKYCGYCGRAAPAVATLVLAFAIRVVGHLLTDGMNPLLGRKLPACLHAKRDTTARKPEHVAYPAQMLKLCRTHESLRLSVSNAVHQSAGMATDRLNTAGPSSTRGLEAAKADQRPALQALPGRNRQPETADRSRPGRGGPERLEASATGRDRTVGLCWVCDAPGLQGHDRLRLCDRLENQKRLRTSASLGLPRASGSAPTIGRASLSM